MLVFPTFLQPQVSIETFFSNYVLLNMSVNFGIMYLEDCEIEKCLCIILAAGKQTNETVCCRLQQGFYLHYSLNVSACIEFEILRNGREKIFRESGKLVLAASCRGSFA